MTNLQVLLLIAAFLVLTVGSFVWYVATWNRDTATLIKVNAPLPHHMRAACLACATPVPFGLKGLS